MTGMMAMLNARDCSLQSKNFSRKKCLQHTYSILTASYTSFLSFYSLQTCLGGSAGYLRNNLQNKMNMVVKTKRKSSLSLNADSIWDQLNSMKRIYFMHKVQFSFFF